MTWLVVGGNGQLGKALSVVLGEQAIDYRAWASEDLDIRSATKCAELIEALKPSVIINAAAWTDVDGAEADSDGAYLVNATGAFNLTIAAKAVGAVFAHISTDYVFSGVSDHPWREDDLRAPISVYGTTKAAGEVAVLSEYAERSYIFRTAWLYSQWGKNFAKTMTRLALSGDSEVRVVDDQVGQPTSAMDLAEQIVDAVIAEVPFGIYHATNSGQGSWCDFAREVFELSGVPDFPVVPVSSSEFVRPAKRPTYSALGHDGWKEIAPMRDWRVALSEAMPAILEAVREDLTGE
jgi:dTDP-4-dehydrorhamnose reductase